MHDEREGPSLLEEIPRTRLKLREGTTAGLLCAFAMIQSGRLRRDVVALRRQADVLAHRMDSDPWSVPLEEILASKRRVLALGGVVDEQLAVLEVLKASNLAVLPMGRLADTLQIAIEITRATDRDIDRLEGRANDLHRRHESAEQDKANRRLGLLTILSAIFMPLTLIAGIYGMNFEVMPELRYRYGYPIVLGAMAVIAGLLARYFRSWRD
jgi:Mg2+ and Co2+ transporter CorA